MQLSLPIHKIAPRGSSSSKYSEVRTCMQNQGLNMDNSRYLILFQSPLFPLVDRASEEEDILPGGIAKSEQCLATG